MAITTPVTYYKLDGNSNDSVSSNNGTDTSISYTSAKIGTGATLNGTSSYISLPSGVYSLFNGTNTYTFSAWVKVNSLASNNCIINTNTSFAGGGTNRGFSVNINATTGIIGVNRCNGGSFDSIVSSVGISTGVWNHIVVRYTSSTVTIFLNGNIVGTGPSTLTATTAGIGTLGVWQESSTNYYWLNGQIDEVAFFSSGISNDDIVKIHNAGRGNTYPFTDNLTTALISYYKLDGNPNDEYGTNNGTNNSNTYSTGKINNGAYFTPNQYISVADNASINFNSGRAFSIGTWIYITSYSGFSRLIDKTQAGFGIGWGLDLSSTTIRLLGNTTYSTTHTIPTGTWTYVVASFDGVGTTKIYVNGSLLGSGAGSYTGAYSGQMRFGIASDLSSPLNGRLDEIGIWNRELSSTEVSQLYNSGSGLSPFGVAYSIAMAVGTFALTGIANTIRKSLNMIASLSSYTLTGIDALFARGKGIVAEVASFVLTGNQALITKTIAMIASVGTFALTGISSTFSYAKSMVADVVGFILTGGNVMLRFKGWTKTPKDDGGIWIRKQKD